MEHPLTVTARRTVEEHDLLPPGARVLTAVSGGQDSLALLHFLAGLVGQHRLQLSAVHVHHGLRGRDADEDADFVAQQCTMRRVPCRVVRCQVATAARLKHLSMETAARIERRRALFAAADEIGAECIALGHTADDRVETVLLNIMRGCGLRGLAALGAKDARIIRPLIGVTRAMTGDYCRANRLVPRFDATNADLSSRRNRVRAELVPYLEAYHNRAIRGVILRLAELADADDRFIEEAAAREAAACVVESGGGALTVSRDVLRAMLPALRRRVVRRMIRVVSGTLEDISRDVVEQAIGCAISDRSLQMSWDLTVPASIRVSEALQVLPRQAPSVRLPAEWPLPVPGTILLPFSGARLTAERICAEAVPRAMEERTLLVPERSVRPPIVARAPRPGDRVWPLGATGHKKLGDCCTDRRVPKAARARLAVVADCSGILWVPGVVADERVRIGRAPCPCIRLTYADGV